MDILPETKTINRAWYLGTVAVCLILAAFLYFGGDGRLDRGFSQMFVALGLGIIWMVRRGERRYEQEVRVDKMYIGELEGIMSELRAKLDSARAISKGKAKRASLLREQLNVKEQELGEARERIDTLTERLQRYCFPIKEVECFKEMDLKDQVRAFVLTCCTIEEDAKVKQRDVGDAYKEFCEEMDIGDHKNTAYKIIEGMSGVERDEKEHRSFHGLRLKTMADELDRELHVAKLATRAESWKLGCGSNGPSSSRVVEGHRERINEREQAWDRMIAAPHLIQKGGEQ